MARTPILAAGGIVVRRESEELRVAVVQRRKDDNWVLPKGKLKADETPIDGARREASEETGHAVKVHDFLGVMTYEVGSGPKLVQFWRMEAVGEAGPPMRDIKAVEWLPLNKAIKRLYLPHEQIFLRHVADRLTEVATVPAGVPSDSAPLVPSADAAAPEGWWRRLWRRLFG